MDGAETAGGTPRLRPAAPYQAGPLASSGAAPDEAVPSPAAAEPAEPTTTAAGPSAAAAEPTPATAGSGEVTSTTAEPAEATEPTEATEATEATAEPATTTAEPAATTATTATTAETPGDEPAAAQTSAQEPTAASPADTAPVGDAAQSGTAPPASGPDPTTDGEPAAPGDAAPAGARHAVGPTYRRVLRRVPTNRAAAAATARSMAAWSRRPAGRLVLPGLLVLLLVAATGLAGAYLVPSALQPAGTAADVPAVTPSEQTPSAFPSAGDAPLPGSTTLTPTVGPSVGPTVAAPATTVPQVADGRPADALATWATQVGTRLQIPAVAMQAYGYAELVLARTRPACRLSWTTLAAIAKIESNHGSANAAVLGADGQAQPSIVGLPLDGQGGRQRITDTDGGALDGDRTYDRAVGPMQFIPTTWRQMAVDADNDGATDPNDIDDAALAAGNYLCTNDRDLATSEDWWQAILSYNDVRRYAQDVFNAANDYGVRSRT